MNRVECIEIGKRHFVHLRKGGLLSALLLFCIALASCNSENQNLRESQQLSKNTMDSQYAVAAQLNRGADSSQKVTVPQKYDNRKIEIAFPKDAMVGESFFVDVSVANKPIFFNQIDADGLIIDSVNLYQWIKVELSVNGCKVDSLTGASMQVLRSDGYANIWKWRLTPTALGRMPFSITVYTKEIGSKEFVPMRVYSKEVEVNVSVAYIANMLDYKWAWTSLVIPLGAFLVKKRRSNQRKKAKHVK